MRERLLSLLLVFGAACGSERGLTTTPTGGAAGTEWSAGAGGSTAGKAADPSSAGATETGGSENACSRGTLPEGTASLDLYFPGAIGNYYHPAAPTIVEGHVLVERVAPEELHLVDDAGQRLTVHSRFPVLSFDGVAVGSRFWLSAYMYVAHQNPYNSHRALRLSLRTVQNGPVLFASVAGTTASAELVLGVPISLESLCRFSAPSSYGGFSRGTGEACTESVELFAATIATTPPLQVLPGTRIEATIQDRSYDVALWNAADVRYPDATCRPADLVPSLNFKLDIVARDWQELAANQPVEPTRGPACHLGTDAPLFTVDSDQLDWSAIEEGNAEYAISHDSTTGDTMSFTVSPRGSLFVKGSAQAQAILVRAGWLSMSNHREMVLRESEGGAPVAVSFSGRATELETFAARADVLGLSVAVEPRCEWMSDACRDGNAIRALSLHDVLFGDGGQQRVATHEQALLTVGARPFEAWVAVSPSCLADPTVTATFLARE